MIKTIKGGGVSAYAMMTDRLAADRRPYIKSMTSDQQDIGWTTIESAEWGTCCSCTETLQLVGKETFMRVKGP